MTHPRMYHDGDPLLLRVRPLCLALPESVEVETWGRPTFRAGTRMFAVYRGSPDPAEPGGSLMMRPPAEERPALLGDSRFSVPPYLGAAGWVSVDLDRVDEVELRELVEASYREVALKRMLRALEQRRAG